MNEIAILTISALVGVGVYDIAYALLKDLVGE